MKIIPLINEITNTFNETFKKNCSTSPTFRSLNGTPCQDIDSPLVRMMRRI